MLLVSLGVFIFSLVFIYIRYWIINNWTGNPANDEKIQKKRIRVRKQKDELSEKLSGKSEEYVAILSLSFEDLLHKLKNDDLKAIQVLNAYRNKALEVTATLNCVTEFIDEADELANQLDTVPKEDRKPLHGLPISLKDNVGVTGYDATVGIAKFLDSPCRADAVIVSVLKSLGAVPFCKTNIPQTMLSFGCDNPVWGQTRNPHNPSRSPGGSSGGEGSLIGGGGSIVGIGSDIGGSARIPAAFCGLASIKPTAGRISYHGFKKSIKGILGVDSVPGILAKDVDAVIGVSRHLFGNRLQSELDPLLPVIDWNEKAFTSQKKLKIGYYLEDDFVPATPGMKRAVKEAMAALEKSGHELVPFRPFDIGNVTALAIKLLQADGGHYFKEIMFGERVASVLMLTKLGVHIPNCFKKFLSFIISFVSPRIAKVFQASGGTCTNSSRELWAAVHLKDDYVRIVADVWKREGLDLLICPAFACPAPEIGLEGRFTPCVSYTLTYNILNFPCGILPVSKESQEDQEELKQYPRDDKLLSEIAKTTEGAIGLPLCVQVVGLPWQEELVLRGMKEIENRVKNLLS